MSDAMYIRTVLFDNRLPQKWLISKLEQNGISTDKTELSSVLAERRKGPKAKRILAVSWQILNDNGYQINRTR